MSQFRKAAWFDFMAPLYDFICNIFGMNESYRKEIISKLQIKGNMRILDAGCGTGSLAIDMAKSGSKKVFAIDPDPKILEIAKRKAIKNNVKVDFRNSYMQKLPFPDGYFDVVISSLVFHHIPGEKGKRNAIKEVKRVLKWNGTFMISDFGRAKIFSIGPWLAATFEEGQENYKGMIPEMMKEEGFKDVKVAKEYKFGIQMVRGIKR
ncbi:MAG: class I SAM-dependent methyltransferase [Nanoarchaeota archaeon]|nr:MAG: class I SAM-dependent methyltransferase [Nanoarchaeota archaeon]